MTACDPERTPRFIVLKAKHGMEDWRGIGENRHILWIVDSPQNVEKFRIVNPGLSVSIVDAAAKDFSGRAVFAMVPTLARPCNLGMLPAVDVVVIDEAHHAAAKTYRRIIDRVRATRRRR